MRSCTFLIPDDLHRDFKIKLAEDERSAKEFFLSCVGIYVKEGGNEKQKKNRPEKSCPKK
ncbi:hypothetical protein ES703_33193 [subsurface metagenome]